MSFGAAATSYDTHRPRYPDQLVADVVAMVPGRRILEIGAGTGIATAAFAARGMAMTCVEPDPQMAAVLSAKFTGNGNVHIDVATFEDWTAAQPADATRFDGLVSAQAWHWTDPATRWPYAHAAIRSGGVIALFWNEDHHTDPRITDAYTAAYDRRGVEIRAVDQEPATSPRLEPTTGQDLSEPWPDVHAEADRYFTNLRTHQYRWTHRISVIDYVARMNTTSAHLILPPEVRDDMTAELTATLTDYADEIQLWP